MKPAQKTELIGVRVDPQLKAQLEKRASANERTVAGEVRVALVKHLKEASAGAA